MRGRPGIDRNLLARLAIAVDAYKDATPPMPSAPMDVEQLRAQHELLERVRESIDALDLSRRAWQWRKMAGIAAELSSDVVKQLQRAGAVL